MATTQAIQDFILQTKNAQVDGHSLANNKKEANSADTTAIDIDDNTKETKIQVSKQNTIWMRFGCYSLTKHHKSILCTGGLLDDIHIGAAQFIIHEQFPKNRRTLKYCDLDGRKAEAHQTTNTHKFTNTTCRWQDRTLDCIVYNGLC